MVPDNWLVSKSPFPLKKASVLRICVEGSAVPWGYLFLRTEFASASSGSSSDDEPFAFASPFHRLPTPAASSQPVRSPQTVFVLHELAGENQHLRENGNGIRTF
jgi:hypothetical protein